MSLPIMKYPTHEVYLKSLDKMIRYRPFLVSEEKILLISKEGDDKDSTINAIKQVIKNCCLDDIDVDSLPIFDVEMFFVHLRMKSVGEAIDINFKCQGTDDAGNLCEHLNDYSLDLSTIRFETEESHTKKIKLSDEIGIMMKYPTLSQSKQLFKSSKDALNTSLDLVSVCVEYVYDKDQVYDNTQYSREELVTFLENLSMEHLNKILNFFVTIPRVVIKDNVPCIKCSHVNLIYTEELYNFFL